MRPKDVLGRDGEEAAVRFLEDKGYSVLHRNLQFKGGEIDIVARIGSTLVIAEVKTRQHTAVKKPYEYVDWKKRRRITKLAEKHIGKSALYHLRYDILSVTLTEDGVLEVEHLENAFDHKIPSGKRKFPDWRSRKNVCIVKH
jgi:putative endonuclease